jgi:hypothetical protein
VGRSGFRFDKDDFLDVLHASEDEEVDRRADEIWLGGTEWEVAEIGELFSEQAAERGS